MGINAAGGADMRDEELYARYLKTNNTDDLKVLFLRYKEELMFFVYGFLGNQDDSEDVMMDAFAVVASGTSRFSGKSSFKTWLFSIGRNIALKSLRKRSYCSVGIEDEEKTVGEVPDSEMPESRCLENERNRILYKALAGINPIYKQVLHLTFFEDMTNDEVAVVMNKSKKQVYNLIARGKVSLRDMLIEMGYDGVM